MSETVKVYVTKYALSDGIREVELEERRANERYAVVKWPGGLNGSAIFSKKDVADTWEEAVARAQEMRWAKIASVKKQLAKLEAMTF